MTSDRARPGARETEPSASAARALGRLRLRLTAWYVATFALVLATLGVLLFAALAHDVSVQLDASLRAATKEIAQAAERREQERTSGGGGAIDAVEELRIPEMQLYLFDLDGRALTPSTADGALSELAREAAASGYATRRWYAREDETLQAFAERFSTSRGARYVGEAVVNRDAIDDRYSTLLALGGVLGALGLALVATGGWLLARKSVAPVERTMVQMRQFMADAAHELRTPVAVIRSRVDVTLERARDAASYEKTLTDLQDEVERLAALVDDLFTLARADADERPFAPVIVQLDEIVLGAVATAGWIASRRAVTLSVEDAEEALILGDAALLRQLALILLDNAVKFSNEGGAVTIVVRSSTDGASLIVEDRGAGIAQADIAHVFDRFYRAESVRGATFGAGLGLAIGRWIAELHGAHILIEAPTGGGTRVTVHFPPLATP